jgi:uncharacterized cupin superfamily protein
MSRRVVFEEDVPKVETARGERFASTRRQLGRAAGGVQLGCSLMEVPPGKRAWPAHFHSTNEEALYILSGSGTLRIGKDAVPLRAGAYVALPVSTEAHQLINTGAEVLRYLCLSTMHAADICVYPDSGKIGVFAGMAPGGDPAQRTLSLFLDGQATRAYWDGEDEGP